MGVPAGEEEWEFMGRKKLEVCGRTSMNRGKMEQKNVRIKTKNKQKRQEKQ